jgi:hypothetical protein
MPAARKFAAVMVMMVAMMMRGVVFRRHFHVVKRTLY